MSGIFRSVISRCLSNYRWGVINTQEYPNSPHICGNPKQTIMDSLPLVSIICLCYNQKSFVREAIESVLAQSYRNIELIIVDDASTDGSQTEILSAIAHKNIRFIDLPKNLGNCAAFNIGFNASSGDFIIDLAADDVLLPIRVEHGINDLLMSPENTGVHFSDAFIINESGQTMSTHYDRNVDGLIKRPIPSGAIYKDVISRYFICPPTMMMKRTVFTHLNGYDVTLKYEDFDFWIRSARYFEYVFNKAPLVKKRVVKNSDSENQFALWSQHAHSTYRICEKIFGLNQTKLEDRALIKRCYYEIKMCAKMMHFGLIPKYLKLISKSRKRKF